MALVNKPAASSAKPASPLAALPPGPGVGTGPATGIRALVTPATAGATRSDTVTTTPLRVEAQGAPSEQEAAVLTIEQLMESFEQSDALKQDTALASEHKGVDWAKTLAALPEDARKLLGNLRADYSRKSQATAEQSRKLEAERTALVTSEAYKKLQELSTKETGEFDPYSPDSFLAKIKQEVAQQLLASMQPVVEKQREEEARASVATFIAQHPELQSDRTLKLAVAKELQSNENLTFEQAFFIVRGKQDTVRATKLEGDLGQFRNAARQAGLRVSTGTRPNERRPPENVRSQGAVAVLRWLQSSGQS